MAVVSMKLCATVLCVWFIAVGGWRVAADAPLPDCAAVVVTLQTCLKFVTSQTAAPSDDCCTGVSDIHHSNPACLCVLSMNDSTTNLLPNYSLQRAGQLQSLCSIQGGATLADCPALLGETNGTAAAPVGATPGPGATAPGGQSPGAASRLMTSFSLRGFILTYLGIVIASTALISFNKC